MFQLLLFGIASAGLFLILVLLLIFEAYSRKQDSVGKNVVIGKFGKATDDFIAGKGKIFIFGEIWNSVSGDDIKKDDVVEVISVDDLVLSVKKSDKKIIF